VPDKGRGFPALSREAPAAALITLLESFESFVPLVVRSLVPQVISPELPSEMIGAVPPPGNPSWARSEVKSITY